MVAAVVLTATRQDKFEAMAVGTTAATSKRH